MQISWHFVITLLSLERVMLPSGNLGIATLLYYIFIVLEKAKDIFNTLR